MQEKKMEKAAKLQQDREQDPEATFAPKVLDYPMVQQFTHGDKCLDLYARVKHGSYARRNNPQPDTEFESNKTECNFTPQINQFGSHLAKPDQSLDEIKGVKEKVALMEKGREQQIVR